MNKKIKNAVRDSFVFPESAHKDDFFRQVGLSYPEKRRRSVPVMFRVTAAAAALVLGAGVWNAVKHRPEHDIGGIEELPAVTTISAESSLQTTVTSAADSNSVRTTKTSVSSGQKAAVTTAVSEKAQTNTVTSAAASVSFDKKGTSAPRSSGGTTVTTTEKTGLFPDEGGFSMKKISSFAASFVIAAAPINVPQVNATAEGYLEHQRSYYFEEYPEKAEIIKAMADKEKEYDFNGDGKFDMWDVYAHYRAMYEMQYNNGTLYINDDGTERFEPPVYEVPDSIKKNVSKSGDLNGDGAINEDDFEIMVFYYTLNYKVPYEFVDPNHYYYDCPDDYLNDDCKEIFEKHTGKWKVTELRDSINSYWEKTLIQFVLDYVDVTGRISSGYSTFCDMVERGIVDIDIDGDGAYTVSDLYDLISGDELCYWSYAPEYGEDRELEKYGVARNTVYTKEEWEKLKNTVLILDAALGYSAQERDYYTAYLFDKIPYKPAYADKYFFEDMRGGYFNNCLNMAMTDYLRYACPGVYSPRFQFTQEQIKADFVNYYRNVKSGELPKPDINLNGTIELEDYILADLLLADDYDHDRVQTIEFDPKVIENFRKNCDYNNNELSGDLSDVVSIQLYVIKELGIPEDEVTNEIARYYKKHPEMDIYDYRSYVLPEEREAEEKDETPPQPVGSIVAGTSVNSIKSYMSSIDMFIPRSGDANNDGKVDISDAVLIMQTYANPDKYQLTNEGRFNADVNETGDGITPKDAQRIQMKLLGL